MARFADPPGTRTGDPARAIRPDFIAPGDTSCLRIRAGG